jgi:endonuclease/exonuclease/phosphatase family metal-dependent hydrolase
MFRILCFNIHGGYDMRRRRDLRRIHNLMNEYEVDIGVFQEIETRISRGGTEQDIETLAGPERPYHLPALTLKEDDGWYGNLIVSKYPIVRGLIHDLETSKSFEPRNAVDALIETPLGPARIIGTHLSLSPFERWSEVRNLVRLIDQVEETEKNPLFLMGDINEWRASSRLLRHLNELLTPIPCGNTFPWFHPFVRLDRAWFSHARFCATARILNARETRGLSDHLPILIEVSSN